MEGPINYYVSQLAANLRHTARVFTEASSQFEGSANGIEVRAAFHLNRGRDLIDIAHAHLSFANQLLEAPLLTFDDFPNIMMAEATPIGWIILAMFLMFIIFGLSGYTLMVHRNDRFMNEAARIYRKARETEKKNDSNTLEEISKTLFLYDRRSSEIQRKIRSEVYELKTKFERLLEDTIPIDERQELKDEITILKKKCEDSDINYYKSSVIPVLMGARGETPTEKLRNAVFGNFTMPILDQNKISEVLGFKCPPDFCNFSEAEADELIGCFLPGTRPHGEVSFSYKVLGHPPGPLTASDEGPPPLTDSEEESGDETGILIAMPTLLRFQPLNDALNNESANSSDYEDWIKDTDLFEDGYVGERLRAPFIRAPAPGTEGNFLPLLNMTWWTNFSIYQLQKANAAAALDYVNYAAAEAEKNIVNVQNRSTRGILTYQHWVTNSKVSLVDADTVLRRPLEICSVYAKIAPKLRELFTTDQDTSCRRKHTADVPCAQCYRHPLCPRACYCCATAITIVVMQQLGEDSKDIAMWSADRMHDVLYYQLLCETQYPAAEEIVFPLERNMDDKVDNSPIIQRFHEGRPSENALEVYNQHLHCVECGSIHVVKRLKMPARKAAYDDLPMFSSTKEIKRIGQFATTLECPVDAFDKLPAIKRPFGHFLGFNSDTAELKYAVVDSMRLTGWNPTSFDEKYYVEHLQAFTDTYHELFLREVDPWDDEDRPWYNFIGRVTQLNAEKEI